jgi:hypothetical protein
MSIRHLCDHRVRIYRRAAQLDAELRSETLSYQPVAAAPARNNAKLNRPRARTGDVGPGSAPIGERTVYMDAGADVEERDVLQVLSGPDAPCLLEVDGPPTRPRGHHVELACRLFNGTLDEES